MKKKHILRVRRALEDAFAPAFDGALNQALANERSAAEQMRSEAAKAVVDMLAMMRASGHGSGSCEAAAVRRFAVPWLEMLHDGIAALDLPRKGRPSAEEAAAIGRGVADSVIDALAEEKK